jgi:RHS repeat-associated protein
MIKEKKLNRFLDCVPINRDSARNDERLWNHMDAARALVSSNGSTYASAYGNDAISTGSVWYYLSMVYNDTDVRVYVNGVLDTNGSNNPVTYNTGIFSNNSGFVVGAMGSISQYYDGLIDEVRVADDARSAAEIKFEYANMAEADNELTWSGEEEVTEVNPPEVLLGNPYLFTGRQFDYETELYYYRARYYNPDIGRFLQTDPVGYQDGMNCYAYCTNNPLNYSDPTGLYSVGFYDPCDRGFVEGANGDQLWEAADDFDYCVPMTCIQDIEQWFIENTNIFIDAVYIFDHGITDIFGISIGLQFGFEDYAPWGSDLLQTVCGYFNQYTDSNAIINFRHCYVAQDPCNLASLANLCNRRVTGCKGRVGYGKVPMKYDLGWETDGPDYDFLDDLMGAHPSVFPITYTIWSKKVSSRIDWDWWPLPLPYHNRGLWGEVMIDNPEPHGY